MGFGGGSDLKLFVLILATWQTCWLRKLILHLHNRMTEALNWIESGYRTFVYQGPSDIKIERLARAVNKSKPPGDKNKPVTVSELE